MCQKVLKGLEEKKFFSIFDALKSRDFSVFFKIKVLKKPMVHQDLSERLAD